MYRNRKIWTPLTVMIAGGALAATGIVPAVAAAPAPSGQTSAAASVGCASLAANAKGKARVTNICNKTINATVSVNWSWDPACKSIGAGRTVTFTWDSTAGRAEYAYDC
ncbi:hypothetical protein [Streptomyces lavendofoliae]|uniref:Uncharacterized protein n=1 Tax=Streptomyces lavendofoliae TaxID=67314 RepID=A0A918M3Y2_9ACTN|nr:hypothetical protein [Streptomyces lavendofoliae]GGU37790.1 hypothetical protein GCM10010274_26320 [Streptomyces lavendofoliae]